MNRTRSISLQNHISPRPVLEWAEWSTHIHPCSINTPLWRPLLSQPHPVFSASYFLMTKCLCETIGVDFSLNPGYSVGSLRGSGTQHFRRLTKQVHFTSASVTACNAFHPQEKGQRGREHAAGEWMSQVGCLLKPRWEQLCVTPRSAFHSIYTHGYKLLGVSGKKLSSEMLTCI